MVEERLADLLRRERSLAGLIVYRADQLRLRSGAYLQLLREVQQRSFDAVILMGETSDPPRDLVAYASQAPLRMGAYHPDREGLINCTLRWKGQERYPLHLAREITCMVGLRYDPLRWRFQPRPEELRAAEQMIHFRKPAKDQPLIGVDADPGKGGRRLAAANLGALVDHLADRLRGKVMVFHIQEGEEAVRAFRRQLRGETLDMPPQGLRDTLALLACCDLFLAGNTELFHAAVAAGVPTLGLFTEADGRRWEPQEQPHAAILRGRPGERMPLPEVEAAVARIMNAPLA
jgi:ADP-heptose:LPS heptosyltransferase